MITTELSVSTPPPRARQTQVLRLVGVAASSWHRAPRKGERRRPGPTRRMIAGDVVQAVVEMATANPWYGYKRIAIMCRRAGQVVKDREAYVVMKDHGLLQKRRTRRAEVYQAAKLFELLPQGPNDLWQMDVTYIHIPGYGWWYAVTVIDYYSRYLLACHLTSSYSAAETAYALKLARAEAERIHGPLVKRPFLVTDNGPSDASTLTVSDTVPGQFTVSNVTSPAGACGHVGNAEPFLDMGLLKSPAHFSLILGVLGGISSKPGNLAAMAANLPKGSHWEVIGIGRDQWWPPIQGARAFSRVTEPERVR